MSKVAEEFFPEGSLACMTHDELGKPRQTIKDQLPGKIVGILKSSINRDDIEVLVSMGRLEDAPSQSQPGRKTKIWVEGEIQKKMGKDLLVFAPALARQAGSHKAEVVDWKIEDLPFERDENELLWAASEFIRKALVEIGTDGLPLDDIVKFMYPEFETKAHTSLVWRAWLQVKNDHYFYGTPDHIMCHSASHIEEKNWTKGSVVVADMSEHEALEEARKAKSDNTKEARKRLLQIMMLRNSTLLKAMTDREITTTAGKAILKRYEKGEEVVTQGQDGGNLCLVVAGELDAIQRFGESPFSVEESQFVLTPGNTFAEECILHIPSRLTVRALRPVEVGLIEVRYCEFLVNESPDALKSIQKLLSWEEDHKPVFDLLMMRKSMLLQNLKDHELKALSKYVNLKPIAKDTLICRESDKGDSMFIVVRGYARAYNDMTITDEMKARRIQSLQAFHTQVGAVEDGFNPLDRIRRLSAQKSLHSLLSDLSESGFEKHQETATFSFELGGQEDVLFNEGAIAVFGADDNDVNLHRHQVNLYRVGQCFEETCSTLHMKRMSSIVALQGSIIGEISKSDLNPILLNNPNAHLALQKHWHDVTALVLISEALSKECPSAMIPKLDEFEIRRLNLGAQLDDWEPGHELLKVGKPCYSIFMVLDGILAVFQKDDDGKMQEVAILKQGATVGEVGLVVGAKATATVTCKTHCALIEIPADSAEGVILSRPDLVDYMHHIKVICQERNEALELMSAHIERTLAHYKAETEAEKLEDNGNKAEPPYFSSWYEGTTVEVVEVSPPVFGNAPSVRGRYERCEDLLDDQLFKRTWRGFDTEWGMTVAWNRVFLSKLSPTVKMQFLSEVSTTLVLTNEQPTWLRYDLRETPDGDAKFLTKWEMSKAVTLDQYKPGGLSPRSMPLGEARGNMGISQSAFEAATNMEAWRALRPFETDKPTDWDDDEIPEKFMSEEMKEVRRNKTERYFHAPSIIKCYSHWEEEGTNSMVFITELIQGTKGVGTAKKAFTCLNLGNYTAKPQKPFTAKPSAVASRPDT